MRLIKAHAYGNDFLLLPVNDAFEKFSTGATHDVAAELARTLCNRHRGIGGDGLIVVRETPDGAETTLLNADGSPSEVSGNGIRCVAAWLAHARGLASGAGLTIGTGAGAKTLHLLHAESPRYEFRAEMGPPEQLRQERLHVAGEEVTAVVLRVGNPQCVVLGPLSDARLHTIAAGLAVHPYFPQGTNVELAVVEAPDRVRILIWERGVGPTEASGTGACAAAVAAAAFGGASRSVDVIAPGGTQHVDWTSDGLWLTGWADIVATVDWVHR